MSFVCRDGVRSAGFCQGYRAGRLRLGSKGSRYKVSVIRYLDGVQVYRVIRDTSHER